MGKKGELVRCSCSKCSRSRNGYTWRPPSTAFKHRQDDRQEESMRLCNTAWTSSVRHQPPDHLTQSIPTSGVAASSSMVPSRTEQAQIGASRESANISPYPSLDLLSDGSNPTAIEHPDTYQHLQSPILSSRNSPAPSHFDFQPLPIVTQPALPEVQADLEIEQCPALPIGYDTDEDESMYGSGYAAANDPPQLRVIYLNAMVLSVIHHSPTEAVNSSLQAGVASLSLAGGIPNDSRPLISLDSVRRRLGLETDPYVLRIPICSVCFTSYKELDIATAETPRCTVVSGRTRCKGNFWTTKLVKNTPTRVPARLICYTRIIRELRKLFMRPSFVKLLDLGSAAHATHQDGHFHDFCCGQLANTLKIGRQRVFCMDGSVRDEQTTQDSEKLLLEFEFGLFFAINIDWFRSTPKGVESTGAIYLTIQNLHRSARFLPANVILACVIPGPKEPPLEELNLVLQPIVDQFKLLYAGISMKMHGKDRPVMVYGAPVMVNADTPARCKCQGTAGHAHDAQFCRCDAKQRDINTEKGYDITGFNFIDEQLLLKKANESRLAPTKTARKAIQKEYGIRWSTLNDLPDWKPYSSAPVDPMHNLFLGLVRHCWDGVLIKGCYFRASQKREFDAFMSSFEWPSHIGRLPTDLCERGGVKKADELRRLISILPIVLWEVWRDPDTWTIPEAAPEIHAQVENPPTFERSCSVLFNLILLLASACRIIGSWAISLPDIERAQTYLQLYCQGLLRMRVPLMPNHHFSMHYERFFKDFGPAYAWWLFSYERFNGLLEKIKLNNKSGDIPTSLIRFWVRLHRLYEMVENLPEDTSAEEQAQIAQLCFGKRDRGTLLSQASMSAADPTEVRGSHFARKVDLRALGEDLYAAALKFAQKMWPELQLKHDREFGAGGRLFLADCVAERLDFILKAGVRYGSTSSSRTLADRYILAKVNGQLAACRIEHHFRLTLAEKEPIFAAAVRRFVTDDQIPSLPWDLHTQDLGYYVGYAGQLGNVMVISVDDIFCLLGLATITANDNTKLWIGVSSDRSGDESTQGTADLLAGFDLGPDM